jgi:hypothetical protein
MDFYSYASFSLSANTTGADFLNSTLLMNASQQAFSYFFKWFASKNNNFDGYWAYQTIGEQESAGFTTAVPISTSTALFIQTVYSVQTSTATITAQFQPTDLFTFTATYDSPAATTDLPMYTTTSTDLYTMLGVLAGGNSGQCYGTH